MLNARDIIIAPIITEKSMKLKETENKVTFRVSKDANKISIKQAVEEIFNVKVLGVNTVNVHPKTKRVGKYTGKTKAYKKAVVQLEEGQDISLFNE